MCVLKGNRPAECFLTGGTCKLSLHLPTITPIKAIHCDNSLGVFTCSPSLILSLISLLSTRVEVKLTFKLCGLLNANESARSKKKKKKLAARLHRPSWSLSLEEIYITLTQVEPSAETTAAVYGCFGKWMLRVFQAAVQSSLKSSTSLGVFC